VTPTVTPTVTQSPSACPVEEECFQNQTQTCYCYRVTNISNGPVNVDYLSCDFSPSPLSVSLSIGDTTNVCSIGGITNSGSTSGLVTIIQRCWCCNNGNCN
jgi:hypothetical protein